ncbi:hypothetical protein N2152v2_009949 [Parachlorella kessleri]
MSVSAVLTQNNLGHLVRKFDGVSFDLFRDFICAPQDYEKFGIYDMNDKQALFRLIQTLATQDSPQITPEPSTDRLVAEEQVSLVDLDGDDTEFLTDDLDLDGFTEPGFVPSPAPGAARPQWSGVARSGAATAGEAEAAAAALNAPDPPKIRVIVRKRPLNQKEVDRGDNDVLECEMRASTIYVNEPKVKVDLTKYTERHVFSFDDVFDETVSNDQVYSQAIQPLISTIFKNGKATCFAYGQTGSGKTYTMGPLPMRAAEDIFKVLSIPDYGGLQLHVSCYEIYGGKLFDLLNGRKKLEIREDAKRRVQIIGIKDFAVDSLAVLQQLIDHSSNARSTGSTGANDESSRSHSIMVFALRNTAVQPARTVGKLSFIDLAGSERGADTYDNDKQTRLEGAEINKSLLALKECIRALDGDSRHIPFRGSKLTEVLRDSFIGKNARTVMIANVSPNSSSCENTLNTLRYADRVKEIRKPGTSAGAGGASNVPVSAVPTTADLAAMLQRMPAAAPARTQQAAVSAPAAAPAAQSAFVLPPAPVAEASQGKVSSRLGALAASARGKPSTRAAEQSQNTSQNAAVNGSTGRVRPSPPGQAVQLPGAPPLQHPAVPRSPGPMHVRQSSSSSADIEDMLGAIMAAEDDLISAHRQHIEDNMASVRDEMNLLGDLDGSAAGDIEVYAAELASLLQRKAASVAALQQKVHHFRKLMKAAMEKQGKPSDF